MMRSGDCITVELSLEDLVSLARACRDAARIDNQPIREYAGGEVIAQIVEDHEELSELQLFRVFLR